MARGSVNRLLTAGAPPRAASGPQPPAQLQVEHDPFRKPVSTFRDHALASAQREHPDFRGSTEPKASSGICNLTDITLTDALMLDWQGRITDEALRLNER